jgi:hypothetical protein
MAAMFEILQSPQPEPVRNWVPTMIYGVWCVLGASGVIISFWKHGIAGRLGFVCYAAVFALASYFVVAARTRQHRQRDVSIRCLILLMLANLPMFVHMLSM